MADVGIVPGVYQLAGGAGFENFRTPSVFKSGAAQANASIWTPAAGLKFRLMGFTLSISNNAASATNDNAIGLTDGVAGTVIASFNIFVPTAAIATPVPGGVTFASVTLPGNGRLSTVVVNPLRLTFSGSLTAGFVTCNAWGTEE